MIPVVLYTGRRKWQQPVSLLSLIEAPEELKAFVPTWETLFIDLQQTLPERLTELGEAVLLALRALQAADAPKEELARALGDAAARLDALPEEAQAAIEKALQYLYLLVRHKRDAVEQDDLFAVLDEVIEQHVSEREEAKMTGAEVLIRTGREQGRKEGREEGREEGVRQLLLELISDKFGSAPSDIAERVMALSQSELPRVRRAIWTARSIEDLGL